MSRRWRGVRVRRGRFFEPPPAPAPLVPPPQFLRARRAAHAGVRVRRGVFLPVPPQSTGPVWVPQFQCTRRTRPPRTRAGVITAPVRQSGRVLDVTGARAVSRWSAAEGPAHWSAVAVTRWSAREGGNG